MVLHATDLVHVKARKPSHQNLHVGAQEEDRVVILRFGHDYDAACMQMDEVRASTILMGTFADGKEEALASVQSIIQNRWQQCCSAACLAVGLCAADLGQCVGPMQKLCRGLPCRHHGGARLQHNVRVVRSMYHHVLLQKQGNRTSSLSLAKSTLKQGNHGESTVVTKARQSLALFLTGFNCRAAHYD